MQRISKIFLHGLIISLISDGDSVNLRKALDTFHDIIDIFDDLIKQSIEKNNLEALKIIDSYDDAYANSNHMEYLELASQHEDRQIVDYLFERQFDVYKLFLEDAFLNNRELFPEERGQLYEDALFILENDPYHNVFSITPEMYTNIIRKGGIKIIEELEKLGYGSIDGLSIEGIEKAAVESNSIRIIKFLFSSSSAKETISTMRKYISISTSEEVKNYLNSFEI